MNLFFLKPKIIISVLCFYWKYFLMTSDQMFLFLHFNFALLDLSGYEIPTLSPALCVFCF